MVARADETAPVVRTVGHRLPAWLWAVATAVLAALPFTPGFTSDRIFYVRDLSLYFWGRFLWLRRTMLGGEWPLWDPYVGAGQSAVADALHQMFLLPVLAIRLIGSEVLGFNLWVALPFPLAALGGWFFFARRFSAPASTLGVSLCALPARVSTGNFPNMSWSVATMPWVLWGVDRACSPCRRGAARCVWRSPSAFQALAGEPVTFSATLALAAAFALFVRCQRWGDARQQGSVLYAMWRRARAWLSLLAAIQLVPMVEAASLRRTIEGDRPGVWSLHPLALVETIARASSGTILPFSRCRPFHGCRSSTPGASRSSFRCISACPYSRWRCSGWSPSGEVVGVCSGPPPARPASSSRSACTRQCFRS